MPTELSVSGRSIAGIETAIEVPSLRLVLDMGRCTPSAVNLPWVLVSHGHLDHIGAIAQHAARRALLKMSEGVYVVPRAVHGAVERLFQAAGELDGQTIPRRVVPLEPGEELELTAGRVIRPFATLHRVPSQGYTVWERRHRLRAEFRGLPGVELGRLRRAGAVLDEPYEAALLSFTGDTRSDVLEQTPELGSVQTLVMEASFLDARVSVEEARRMGHVHLDELRERHALFQNESVVLSHFSARHTPDEIRAALRSLPEDLVARARALLPE